MIKHRNFDMLNLSNFGGGLYQVLAQGYGSGNLY